jgi:hypothetical protein
MKSFWHLTIAACVIIASCEKKNGNENSYPGRMRELADAFQANPKDLAPLHRLEQYTTDSDYWNRSYAYGQLGSLAMRNVGGCQPELIPYFEKALNDPDHGIRQAGIQAISDIGSPAVQKACAVIIRVIYQANEDYVTWLCAQSLGELQDKDKLSEALDALFAAARAVPPAGTPEQAPQLRYYALDSIEKLGSRNKLPLVPRLEPLLGEGDSFYKKHVAGIILKLDPSNEAAHRAVRSQ